MLVNLSSEGSKIESAFRDRTNRIVSASSRVNPVTCARRITPQESSDLLFQPQCCLFLSRTIDPGSRIRGESTPPGHFCDLGCDVRLCILELIPGLPGFFKKGF